ncbi:MAG: AAA family ATPase [Candidatus Saccharimonadales bacterium]
MSPSLVLHPSTQEAVNRYLAHAPQSVLLTGAAGSGLTTLAHSMAASLLGVATEKLPEHPYARIITSENDKIGITNIRDLQQFVSLQIPSKRQIGRVILIDDAHTLTREAQNALLKLLEEPPKQTILLLVSSRSRLLLPTILSRVQQLHISRPEESEVIKYLEQRGYEQKSIAQLLLATGQNIAETIRQLELGNELAGQTVNIVKQALAAEPFERLLMVERELKDKTLARDFVSTLSTVASSSVFRVSERGDVAAILRWQSILAASEVASRALRHSGNQKLVLTELMLAL